MSKPVIITASRRVGVIGPWPNGSSSRHRTKSSRWFSGGSRSSLEGIETKTEHRLSLCSPMWAGRCLLLRYTRSSSPREDLARHVGCQPRNLNLCFGSRMEFSWPCKKSDLQVSRKNEARDKKIGGRRMRQENV
jgi:hypothetical protein